MASEVFVLTFNLRLCFSKTLCKLLLKEQSLQSVLVMVNSVEEERVKGGGKGGGELHLSPGESKFKARSHSTIQNSLSQFSLHYHSISAYQNGELTNGFVKLAQKFTKGGRGGISKRDSGY